MSKKAKSRQSAQSSPGTAPAPKPQPPKPAGMSAREARDIVVGANIDAAYRGAFAEWSEADRQRLRHAAGILARLEFVAPPNPEQPEPPEAK